MKYVRVVFKHKGGYDGDEYHYLNNPDLNIKEGDMAVVDVNGSLKVVKVIGFSNIAPFHVQEFKSILQVVPVEVVQDNRERELLKASLRSDIMERVKHLEWLVKAVEVLEKTGDETLRQLLEEYEKLL